MEYMLHKIIVRIALLESRNRENGAIVKKLLRQKRKIEQNMAAKI